MFSAPIASWGIRAGVGLDHRAHVSKLPSAGLVSG